MMQKPIPPPQYWTGDAAEWASQQLGLRYHSGMQDWPWEVAETEDLEKYFQLYRQLDTHAAAGVRIVVMEMILEAASNGTLSAGELQEVWPRINALLDQNADSLATTAMYWCSWHLEEQDVEEYAFRIVPYMRTWWRANYPIPTEAERDSGGLADH
jgi:hypothetical protein